MITIMIISEQNDANKQTQQLNKQTKAKTQNQTKHIYIYTFIKRYTLKTKLLLPKGRVLLTK